MSGCWGCRLLQPTSLEKIVAILIKIWNVHPIPQQFCYYKYLFRDKVTARKSLRIRIVIAFGGKNWKSLRRRIVIQIVILFWNIITVKIIRFNCTESLDLYSQGKKQTMVLYITSHLVFFKWQKGSKALYLCVSVCFKRRESFAEIPSEAFALHTF